MHARRAGLLALGEIAPAVDDRVRVALEQRADLDVRLGA